MRTRSSKNTSSEDLGGLPPTGLRRSSRQQLKQQNVKTEEHLQNQLVFTQVHSTPVKHHQHSGRAPLKPRLTGSQTDEEVQLQIASQPEPEIETETVNSHPAGLWHLLPEELLEGVLKLCSTTQLGMLEATCSFFRKSGLIDKIAKQRLKAIPRARGLKPNKKEREHALSLLHYVNAQSLAAAQATSIACGCNHTVALLIPEGAGSSGRNSKECKHFLYTFGRGFHGQLGTGQYDDQNKPVYVTLGFRPCQDNADLEEETMPAVVACGGNHSSAISRRGEVFAWGEGLNGELGIGQWVPVILAKPKQCSIHTRIVSIAAGAHHTLAIAETGALYACGKNNRGQLGTGTVQDCSRLTRIQSLETRIVSAAAGVAHSLALAADGSTYTWGDGSHGQLGHPQLQQVAFVMPHQPVMMTTPTKLVKLDPATLTPDARVTAISAGAHHSMVLTVGGILIAFGRNTHGALGTGDTLDRWKPTKVDMYTSGGAVRLCQRAVQVVCGTAHTVVLVSNGGCMEVRTSGANNWGQLGLGDTKDRQFFTATAKIPGVVAVQSGEDHCVAVTSTGHLYVWGRGDSGQLGCGDFRAKRKPTLLRGFTVIHPDRTLRRHKRSIPLTRPIDPEAKRQRLNSLIVM